MALSIPQETDKNITYSTPSSSHSGENTGTIDIVFGSGKAVFLMQHSMVEPGLES